MSDLTEYVVDTAKRLEGTDDFTEIDYLEHKLEVSPDASVREVTIVVTTGGPQIEVDCLSGRVRGYWGGESHTTHVNSAAVDELGTYLADIFEDEYQ